MAIWPNTLPAPLIDELSAELGTDTQKWVAQSGRVTSVRYGVAAPDRWNIKLRLLCAHSSHGNQVVIFEQFYRHDLLLGANWFSAGWITTLLGYSDHKGKIHGYPAVSVKHPYYKDVTMTILIKKSSACVDDRHVW